MHTYKNKRDKRCCTLDMHLSINEKKLIVIVKIIIYIVFKNVVKNVVSITECHINAFQGDIMAHCMLLNIRITQR